MIEQLDPGQILAAAGFLEFPLLDPVSRALAIAPMEDDEIGEEERQAWPVPRSGSSTTRASPFEQVAAGCGFTMDQIREQSLDEERNPAA